MTFLPEQIEQLRAKLSVEHVKTRKQAGRTLSYLEGWVAIDEANRIFGFDGWNRETIFCEEVSRVETTIGQRSEPGWKVGYCAKVRVSAGGVVREGTGHGSASMRDLFECIESAAKEAETDAMKRALMTFGNPFGLALYDKEQRNVSREGGGYGDQADKRMAEGIKSALTSPALIPVPDMEDTKERWVTWCKTFKQTVNRSKAPEEVDQWWQANDAPLTNLKIASEKAYDDVHAFCDMKRQALTDDAGLTEMDAG